jgi:hypothetical protein
LRLEVKQFFDSLLREGVFLGDVFDLFVDLDGRWVTRETSFWKYFSRWGLKSRI